jgi:hypothetical protein
MKTSKFSTNLNKEYSRVTIVLLSHPRGCPKKSECISFPRAKNIQKNFSEFFEGFAMGKESAIKDVFSRDRFLYQSIKIQEK